MNHVAIDLGSRQSQICTRRPDATIEWEGKVPTQQLPAYFADIPRSRVILETCAESTKVAEAARACHHEVRLVPATLARMLGVGERGIKTDQRDARALSQSSCRVELPSIHIRSKESREHLTRLGMRASMVTSRTQLINTVRGWLRAELITVKSTTACFPNNVRKHFAGIDQEIPSYVDHLLICIEELNQKITEADTEIESAAKDDPVCVQLMSVPGVGPITSLCYKAVVDVVDRFPNAHSVESYLGLTPGEKSSSFTVRRTSITKAGPAMMRHYLTQASLSLRRLRPNEPISRWVAKIAGRRGKQVATIATARKLAGILFAMWRDGTNYAPSKAASVKALEESTTH